MYTVNITKAIFKTYLRKKNRKSVKQSETVQKLSETIRKGENVDSNSTLYCDMKKSKHFLNVKIAKRAYAIKGYASTYNVEILKSFNLELQLKDSESAIKSNLIELHY